MTVVGTLLARFDRQSLNFKLAAGFSALVVLMLGIGAVAMISHRQLQTATDAYFNRHDRIAHLSLQSSAAMIKARRYEKDYLLGQREFGHAEAKSRYATLVRMQLAAVRGNMAAIRSLTDDPDLDHLARGIATVAERYESGFLQVVELYGRLGSLDAGLQQQSPRLLHAMQLESGQGPPPGLMIQFLSLRRNEKNFMIRGQEASVPAFRQAMAEFRRELAAISPPPEHGPALLRLADDYQGLFMQYVALHQDIADGTLAYLGEVHAVEPMLGQLHQRAREAVEASHGRLHTLNATTVWTVVAASLAAILLGLAVSVFVARNLCRSLRRCADFAASLGAGNLTARLTASGHNEFGVLIRELNRMADSLQASHHLEGIRAAQISRLNRGLRVLGQCHAALTRAGGEPELLDEVCRHLVDAGGYRLAWVGLALQDEARSIRPAAIAGCDDGYVESLGLSWGDLEGRRGTAGRAIHAGRPVIVDDVLADPLFEASPDMAARHGLVSCIALPLVARSRVLGALSIYSGRPDDFDDEDVILLRELAGHLALGIASLQDAAARAAEDAARADQANEDPASEPASEPARRRDGAVQRASRSPKMAAMARTRGKKADTFAR